MPLINKELTELAKQCQRMQTNMNEMSLLAFQATEDIHKGLKGIHVENEPRPENQITLHRAISTNWRRPLWWICNAICMIVALFCEFIALIC